MISFFDGDLPCRVMPYLGSFLFIELFYAVIKLSFIYGFAPGIITGVALFAGLFAVILFSALGNDAAMLILIIVCEIHAAMACSSVVLSALPGHGADPVLLLVYRAILFPFEAVISVSAVRYLRNSRSV
ncbi:MAG TPA: hypothetical protein PKK43_00405 [Spirochaetota bacterium]|nr:hypothetical protein [Spirochaetota bacterium]